MGRKKDYLLVSLIGFLIGLLLLPILKNIQLPFFEPSFENILLAILVLIVFANLALALSFLIGSRLPVFLQFAKFVAVGTLNTLLDLGVLNVLIFLTGIAVGFWYSLFKGISFILAVINSYFWNKYWTFTPTRTNAGYPQTKSESPRQSALLKEFSQFLIVSLIGLGINIGTASLVVNVVGPAANISPERWANIGALAATAVSLIWNFIGYKFFVFKK